jgi:hypothetical protein
MFKETIECIDFVAAELIAMRSGHPDIEDGIPYSLGAFVNTTNPEYLPRSLFLVPSVEDRDERNEIGLIVLWGAVVSCMPDISRLKRQMILKNLAKRAKAIGYDTQSDGSGITDKMTVKKRFFPSAVILGSEVWRASHGWNSRPFEGPNRQSVFSIIWREHGDVPRFCHIPFTMNGDGVVILGDQTEPVWTEAWSPYFETAMNIPLFNGETFE